MPKPRPLAKHRLTSVKIPPDVDRMLHRLGRPFAPWLWRALRELYWRDPVPHLWIGTGEWEGWFLTMDHPVAKADGAPVLIRPSGEALRPSPTCRYVLTTVDPNTDRPKDDPF